MLREIIATGETIEQAVKNACDQLEIESCGDNFEVIEMPVKKTFGIFGGSPAKVRVFTEVNPAKAAADYLASILNHMDNQDISVTINEEDNGAILNISGGDPGYIIGYRGETLHALQYLSGLIANQLEENYYRITLNVGNYREKRHETLTNLGIKMANKVLRTGRIYALEPMNPYERRIIHAAVKDIAGVKSWSKGEHICRHVVIGPENKGYMPNKKI